MIVKWTNTAIKMLKEIKDKSIQRKLLEESKRLQKDYNFFKPLTGDLKDYRRLRVGRYRIIYKIKKEDNTVWVVAVGIRKDKSKIDIYEIFQKINKRKS